MKTYPAATPADTGLLITVEEKDAVSLAHAILAILTGEEYVYYNTDSFSMRDEYDMERGTSLVSFREHTNLSNGYMLERDQAMLFVKELFDCLVEGNMPFVCRIR